VNAIGEQLHVVGEILRELTLFIEADYERFVEAGTNRVLQEADGRVLFESKRQWDRTADVDEQAEVQGKIGFAAKLKEWIAEACDRPESRSRFD